MIRNRQSKLSETKKGKSTMRNRSASNSNNRREAETTSTEKPDEWGEILDRMHNEEKQRKDNNKEKKKGNSAGGPKALRVKGLDRYGEI